MDVRVGLWRRLSAEELMLLNCGVGEDSWGPLDCKEIQPVHCEGDQPWVFFGRNDADAETPVLWPPHVKSWLIGKVSDSGRDWVQEEKGMTEDVMAGWHHWLDGRESGWTPGVGYGQRGLACCDSWGCKESDTTERLNWTDVPNIPGSYAILFFTASDFTCITSHIHCWALFSLWLCLFILSGVISPLFSSSILDTYCPGEFIFQCPIFLPFHTVHGVVKARYWSGKALGKCQLVVDNSLFYRYKKLSPCGVVTIVMLCFSNEKVFQMR